MVTGHGNHGKNFQLIAGQASIFHCDHLFPGILSFPEKAVNFQEKSAPAGAKSPNIEVTLGCLHVLSTTKGYSIEFLISNIIG